MTKNKYVQLSFDLSMKVQLKKMYRYYWVGLKNLHRRGDTDRKVEEKFIVPKIFSMSPLLNILPLEFQRERIAPLSKTNSQKIIFFAVCTRKFKIQRSPLLYREYLCT